MRHRVFVYGTLKRGGVYHRLLARAVFLGEHRTDRAYTLLHLGGWPGAVEGGRTAIAGEVYGVGPGTLARLDVLEEVPRAYVRKPIPTPWGAAWIYLLRRPPGRRRRIPGGEWRGPGRPG